MKDAAAKLFADKSVDFIIGYRNGSLPNTARPFFVRNAQDVENLVWNQFCIGNLATFLPKLFEKPQKPREDFKAPRIAILAKGCDARSIAGLVKEKQVVRANLVIIGMPCAGMNGVSKEGNAAEEEFLALHGSAP